MDQDLQEDNNCSLANFTSIFFCSIAAVIGLTQQDSCPTFGSDTRTQDNTRTDSGLVINFGDPAQCSGSITAWNYCFNLPSREDSDRSYSARFVVYRREQNDSNVYWRVEGSVTNVELSNQTERGQFCRELTPDGTGVRIQRNDLIGACLYGNSQQRRPLDIVSMSQGTGQVYLSTQYRDCLDEDIDMVDVTERNFENRDWILHLNVQISE